MHQHYYKLSQGELYMAKKKSAKKLSCDKKSTKKSSHKVSKDCPDGVCPIKKKKSQDSSSSSPETSTNPWYEKILRIFKFGK